MARRTAALAVVCVLSAGAGGAYAAFVATTSSPTSSITAAPDWTPPTASGSVIARASGCTPATPGFVKQGRTYHVYAATADAGNPASGVATATADVGVLTSGRTAEPLAAGSFSVGGVAYDRRSAPVNANVATTDGAAGYSLALADGAGNSTTATGFAVTVDNTPPAATDFQPENAAGGTVGRPDPGDLAVFTFSEPIEPCSLLAGWDGAGTAVTVRIANSGGNDTLTVRKGANTAQIPLGSVALRSNSVSSTTTFSNSTMARSGNVVTVTLGTVTAGVPRTHAVARQATWAPHSSPYDRAQNTLPAVSVDERGANDPQF